MSLHQLMIEVAKAEDHSTANLLIAQIQDTLGQDDGGLAGQYFNGEYSLEDGSAWYERSLEDRFDFVRRYVISELESMDEEGGKA